MNTLEYENLHETKKHVSPQFPYNTYLCSIPLDFAQVPPHWHRDVELIVIKKGSGMIAVDMEPQQVHAGDIILVRPGQIHSISTSGDNTMEYENIIFQTELLYCAASDLRTQEYFTPYFTLEYELPWLITSEPPQEMMPQKHFLCDKELHRELSDRIRYIDRLCSEHPAYYELSVKGNLFHFFYILFSAQGSPVLSTHRKSLEKAKQIIGYIENHYAEPITVQTAADEMGFSASHFMKFFRQTMHTTFTNYLNNYRLTIAGRLLLATDDSVLDVSEKSGFNNLSYFNRLFRQQFGVTPREYRGKRN